MATVTQIDSNTFELQEYSSKDENLVPQFNIDTSLTQSSYIELFTYDLNNTIINSDINFRNYSVTDDSPSTGNNISQFNLSPDNDILRQGYSEGEYIAYYNFLNKKVGDSLSNLFISEISSDRTEIRLDSTTLSNLDIIDQTNDFINFREDQEYFVDFYLNLGDNNLLIANNIQLENENTDDPTILIKLYEPLPSIFALKSTLWVVTIINEPLAFQVVFPVEPVVFQDYELLGGPNFAIPVKNEVNNSSQNLSYNDIVNGAPTNETNQVDSLLSQSAINISVNYNEYSDFIHFSSAQTRIENFYYKTGLIESYNTEISQISDVSGSSTSQLIYNKKISNIITNFDKFEYFMYYSSGSTNSYPKTTDTLPYSLYSITSSQALTWLGSTDENSGNYGGLLLSASNYDNGNPDQLLKSIPEYLREDSANKPYDLFVDMVAQYYDNIWLYTKDITQKYNADNRLDFGISKDLVSDAIKDFGVKLYQNNFSNQELYTAFLGITPSGSLFPFPEITGSLPVPSGMEYVDTLISASNNIIPMDDVNKSLYKRIYHNIPYLLKSKGTLAGLRALITSYGIPDTILRITEFGGKDQVNANDYDLYQNNFNYAFNTSNNYISSSFLVNSAWGSFNGRPQTIQFRFKAEEITSAVSPYGLTNLSQSLLSLKPATGPSVDLVLEYSGSGLSTDSYSGASISPNYQYGTLKLFPNNTSPNFTSISLPFFDGGWWSVMLTFNPELHDSDGELQLYAGNKIYNGNDGTSLGFYDEISIVAGAGVSNPYKNSNIAYFATSSQINPSTLIPSFSGSLQEIRYYNTIISESVFKDFIMNPLSFEGNGINSAPDQLIFRAALGSELLQTNISTSYGVGGYGSSTYGASLYNQAPTGPTITTTTDTLSTSSIHPRVTGSWELTSSFINNSRFNFSDKSVEFSSNTETFFLDQPAAGIKNRITDKIRSENNTLASGNVLSSIRSLSQNVEASASYTDNINYLEVAFSPQNQINDDIIGQMGHFNIGDYIGDPSERFTGDNYPDLNDLSEEYFKKYIKQYDLTDFIRLIKFFDNSLFKMIKDFIPARTGLASGLVIKQHLLERNKYPQPQVSREEILETGSIDMVKIEGGAGGVFNPYNVSYDLDFISGSEAIQTCASGSSTGNTFNDGDTTIPNTGTFITNASGLNFFIDEINPIKSFVPNLWVEIQNNGTTVTDSFTSGSSPTPDLTDVSGSGTATINPGGNNIFNINTSLTNASIGLTFPPFTSSGYIQFSEPIFNNGSGTTVASSSVSSLGSTITTVFPTASLITNVSASLTSVTNNFGGGYINRYDIGGSITNASDLNFTLFDDGYVSASIDAFTDPSGNVTDKSPIEILGSGGTSALRTLYPTSSIFTNVTATATVTINSGNNNVYNIGTLTTNATSYNIFVGGYVSSSNEIFNNAGSLTNQSPISAFTSTQITTTLPTASVNTPVTANLGTSAYYQPSTHNGRRFTTTLTTAANNPNAVFPGGYVSASGNSPDDFIFDLGGGVSSSKSEITFLSTAANGNLRVANDIATGITTNVYAISNQNANLSTGTDNVYDINVTTNSTTSSVFMQIAGFVSSSEDKNIFRTSLAPESAWPVLEYSGSISGYNTGGGTGINGDFTQITTTLPTASVHNNFGLTFTATPAGEPSAGRYTATNVNTNCPGGIETPCVDWINRGILVAIDKSTGLFVEVFQDANGNNTESSSFSTFPMSTAAQGIRPDLGPANPMPGSENYTFTAFSGSMTQGAGGTMFVTNTSRSLDELENITLELYHNEENPNKFFPSSSARSTSQEIQFYVYSGSKTLTPTTQTFYEPQPLNVGNETFTVYSGSIEDVVNPIFPSSSARPITETQMEVYSGSLTLTPATQTFQSASAREISGLAFDFHTGSLSTPGNTTFISESFPAAFYNRAHISSITNNTLDFNSNFSVSSNGVAGNGFEFFTEAFGSSNCFISNSFGQARYDFYNLNPQYPLYPTVTQSYTITTPSISGSVTRFQRSQDEFYNGELSGSVIITTDGELNTGCDKFKNPQFASANYKLRIYNSLITTEEDFQSVFNEPTPGHLSIYFSGTGSIPPGSTPEVTSNNASFVTANNMFLNGNIFSQGSDPITEKGFYFGTNPTITSNPKTTVQSFLFRSYQSGLTQNTPYYFAAYAINAIGEGIGVTKLQSTTGPANTPTSFIAVNPVYGTTAAIDTYSNLQTDFKWNYSEATNVGDVISLQTTPLIGGGLMVPTNQSGNQIYNFNLTNISVISQDGRTNYTNQWNITKQGAGTSSEPHGIQFKKVNTVGIYTGIANNDNFFIKFTITSTVPGLASTSTNFNLKPSVDANSPYQVSNIVRSISNRIPYFPYQDPSLPTSEKFVLNSDLTSYVNSDGWSGTGNEGYLNQPTIVFRRNVPSSGKLIDMTNPFSNGSGGATPTNVTTGLTGLQFKSGDSIITPGGTAVICKAFRDTNGDEFNHFTIRIASNGEIYVGYDGTYPGFFLSRNYYVTFTVRDASGGNGSLNLTKRTFSGPLWDNNDLNYFAFRVRMIL